MSILVAYATNHGATQGIAERIAERLAALGQQAHARPGQSVHDLTGYDAFVIGSAAYMRSWLKEATEFVRRNQAFLATRPVWLFSSGPLGTDAVDAKGRDVIELTVPAELAEFERTIHLREHRAFFGAYDPTSPPIGLRERGARLAPSDTMPAGDFRDWPGIEGWAHSIAAVLAPVPAVIA
ncbi:MAG: flavodoxin domain-containing protein [Ktedonobacterales bacterium]